MKSFWRLMTYVRRTIVRARLRSLLTVLGAALALGLFAFVFMLERGVNRMHEQADQPVLVVFQSSRFCPLTSLLPMRYLDEIKSVDGVDHVLPTLMYINSCRANLDLVTLHGVDGDVLPQVHDLDVFDGDLSAWQALDDGALVGQRLAERRGLKVGDRVRLTNVDVKVAGIYKSPGAGLDNIAFVQLDQLQLARKQQGIATEFFVRVKEGTDPQRVAEIIDTKFAKAEQPTDTKTMQAFVQGAVGEVAEVVDFARLLGYVAVAIVILLVGNTVYISAQTRRRELGVMETIGVTKPMLGGLVAMESVFLSLLGGVIGVGVVALVATLSPITLGIEGWGIDIKPDTALFVVGGALALAVGVIAAIGPALLACTQSLGAAVKA